MPRRSRAWLSAAAARGELLRLRRGIFVEAAAWKAAPPWTKHRAEVAAAGLADPAALLCRESALAVHGLPLLEVPREVRLRATSPSRAGLSRGRPLGSQGDTTPVRTRPTRRVLPPVPRLLTAAEARLEYRRISHARQHLVVPGIRIGSSPAASAVEFQLPQGIARVDFDWERVFGEFDGRVKYDDAGVLSGLSDQSVYWNEKRREEQIEMVTGKRSVRWGWEDLRNPWVLEKKLLNRGVPSGRGIRLSPAR